MDDRSPSDIVGAVVSAFWLRLLVFTTSWF